jgi:hypothetical protein
MEECFNKNNIDFEGYFAWNSIHIAFNTNEESNLSQLLCLLRRRYF